MRTRFRTPCHVVAGLAAASLAAVCAPLATAGQSSAAPDTAPGQAAAQSESDSDLQLTAAQKAKLDKRATTTLRNSKPGGKRIAPDKIAWDNGAVVLTLAIDGQTRDNPSSKARDGHVHLWDGHHYSGDRLSLYKCRFEKFRWYDFTNKTSSWSNNQYGSPIARLSYWTGSDVRHINNLVTGAKMKYIIGGTYDNRADFLRPC